MFAPAKRTSAPRLSTFISACSLRSRSLRSRSKSTRICQSAPVWLYIRRGLFRCGPSRKAISIPVAGSTFRSFHRTKSAIAHLSRSKFALRRSTFTLRDDLASGGNLSCLLRLLRLDQVVDLLRGGGQRRDAHADGV